MIGGTKGRTMGFVYKSTDHHVTVDHDAGTYRIDTIHKLPPGTFALSVGGVQSEGDAIEITMTESTGDVPLATDAERIERP